MEKEREGRMRWEGERRRRDGKERGGEGGGGKEFE